jgi:hypothetical protein
VAGNGTEGTSRSGQAALAAHHDTLIDGVPLPGQTDRQGRTRLTLAEAHAEVLRLVEYIDKDAATWLGQNSRVPELLRTRP